MSASIDIEAVQACFLQVLRSRLDEVRSAAIAQLQKKGFSHYPDGHKTAPTGTLKHTDAVGLAYSQSERFFDYAVDTATGCVIEVCVSVSTLLSLDKSKASAKCYLQFRHHIPVPEYETLITEQVLSSAHVVSTPHGAFEAGRKILVELEESASSAQLQIVVNQVDGSLVM